MIFLFYVCFPTLKKSSENKNFFKYKKKQKPEKRYMEQKSQNKTMQTHDLALI